MTLMTRDQLVSLTLAVAAAGFGATIVFEAWWPLTLAAGMAVPLLIALTQSEGARGRDRDEDGARD